MYQPTTESETVSQLNALLRGELSAMETYGQVIEKFKDDQTIASGLERCRLSHQTRVGRLQEAIRHHGGVAATDSGAWGTFAKLYEGSAAVFGKESAIAALECGEEHGLKQYRDSLDKLDERERGLVVNVLLPEQFTTHEVLKKMKVGVASTVEMLGTAQLSTRRKP